MAPTTLPGQVTQTTPFGRDPKVAGYPVMVCEMLSQLTGTAYAERVSVDSPAHINAAKKAIRKGGLGPCAANGANEEAVKLFLEDKIGFLDIGRLVEAVVDSDSFGGDYTLADVYECDRMARAFVRAHL